MGNWEFPLHHPNQGRLVKSMGVNKYGIMMEKGVERGIETGEKRNTVEINGKSEWGETITILGLPLN